MWDVWSCSEDRRFNEKKRIKKYYKEKIGWCIKEKPHKVNVQKNNVYMYTIRAKSLRGKLDVHNIF